MKKIGFRESRKRIVHIIRLFFFKIIKLFYPDLKYLALFLNNKINGKFKYINKHFLFFPNNKGFNRLFIDASYSFSELCEYSKKFPSDKSPYNNFFYRHPYTPIYSFIFAPFKYQSIYFAEIGIFNNDSVNVWRNYFKKANIYGFEFNDLFLKNAKKQNLRNVFYSKINVKESSSINEAFKNTKEKFNIIIDDSTHEFEDQIRVIKNVYRYLLPGGILIIEDIPNKVDSFSEERFFKEIGDLRNKFHLINFIDCNHLNKYSRLDDSKMLYMVFKG